MFVEIAVLWRTLKKSTKIKQVNLHNHEIKFTLLTINHKFFWKQKILKLFFSKRTNKIHVFNYVAIENFKTT